jgi:alpha-1,2-mannosyltransferase
VSVIHRSELALARWLTPGRCEVYSRTIALVFMSGYLTSQLAGPGRTDAWGTIVGADFSAFWIGGRLVLEGRADALYDLAVQKSIHDALIFPLVSREVHPFVNPPFFATAMVPLALLPYESALAIWWSVQVGMLIALCAWFRRTFLALRARTLPRTFALTLLFFPTLAWFCYGQNTGLTLALLSAWFLWLRLGREPWAGLALGLLFFKPQLGLGPMLVMVLQRRWRVIGGAACGAAVWIALGMATVPRAMRQYLELAPTLFGFIRDPSYNTWGLLSGFGFGALLVDGVSKAAGSVFAYGATLAGVIAIALVTLRMKWEPGTRAWDLRMAGLIALGIVTSPQLFLYDAMLLLLPLALLLAHEPGQRDQLLDGGPLLAQSGAMVIALFVGPYASLGIGNALRALGLPALVPQLATLTVVFFALGLVRAGATR